jgi:hypothetical protein
VSIDYARTIESSSGANVLAEEGTAARYFNRVNKLILNGGKPRLASRLVTTTYIKVNINLR